MKTESAPDGDADSDLSLKKHPDEAFEHDLLQRLDSLFRNVLTKQFGRKLAKAFFKHIFPLVAEELQKVEERRMRWEKKRKGSKQTIEDRRDTFSGELRLYPTGKPMVQTSFGPTIPAAGGPLLTVPTYCPSRLVVHTKSK